MSLPPAAAPRFETLEPRILYSADAALLLGAHGFAEPAQVRVLDAAPIATASTAATTSATTEPAREIVFIDSRVPDAMRLADALARERGNGIGSSFDIVVIGPDEDGVQQIGAILAHEHGLAAIHLISHGSDGAVELGSSRLDAARLATDGAAAADVAGWGRALAAGGDLLLYGCDVAQDAAGQGFVRSLATLTGADVAASIGLTGSAELGGDWTLEYSTGAIHTQLTAQRFDRLDWAGVLATFTVSNTNNAGAGSLRQAIADANAASGTDSIAFAIGAAPVGGVYTIALTSALPQITGRVTIDGTTQVGFAAAPLIVIDGSGAGNADGLTLAAGSSGSTIRGLVIGGFNGNNLAEAIRISSSNNQIVGNWLGLNGSGNGALANYAGISIDGDSNMIGGSTAADRNVISGNAGFGVNIDGGSTNVVIGNYIGTGPDGSAALGNRLIGVRINDTPAGSRIGGAAAGEGNVVANTVNGAGIAYLTGSGAVAILGNSVHANAGSGIDLQNDGPTANDSGDADSGPNGLQNTPVLRSAGSSGGNTAVIGSLNSNASTNYRIEFFASPGGDASGYGEGQTYLGYTSVTTDPSGNTAFRATLAGVTVQSGYIVSATATVDIGSGRYGASSEFAANVQAAEQLQVSGAADTYIDGNSTADNYGQGSALLVSGGSGAVGDQRSLLKFDLSGLPSGATVTGAALVLNATATSGAMNVKVYELTQAWSEGNGAGSNSVGAANWNSATLSSAWGTAGGSFNAAPVATRYVSASGEQSWDITALAQAWASCTKTNNGLLLGSPDGGSAAAGFDSTQGTTPPRLVLTYTTSNHAPVITQGATASLGSSYSEDSTTPAFTVPAAVNAVGWSDADSGALRGMLVTASSGNGRWQYTADGSGWRDIGAVSAAHGLLLDHNASLRYVGDARNGETPALQFRAWDESSGVASSNAGAAYADPAGGGGSSAFSAQTANAAVTIFSVNDAPVLDASGTMAFTAITEDQVGNAGQTVASLIASAVDTPSGDPITDVDNGALEGIAVNAASNGNGGWEYSLDGGGSWQALGSVSDGAALLLRDSDLLRFAPDGRNGGSASLGFRAWDRSAGSAGSRVDASVNGGSSAFSSASTTAAIVVGDVNDAPVLANVGPAGPIDLAATDEDTPSAATRVSDLLASAGGSDVDTGALGGIALTATSGRGSFHYSTDGVAWANVGAVSNGNALLLGSGSRLRYLPDGIDGETASFAFVAWDQTSGSASSAASAQHASAGSGGGSSAFSTLAATARIAVAAVNDAPVIAAGNATLAYVENSGPVLIGATVTVGDVDSADFDGGQLTVQLSANGQPEDRLTLQHQGDGAGQVGIAGSVVRYGGVVVGSFNGPVTGSAALVVSFNANATAAVVQAVTGRLSYEDTSDDPSPLVRNVQATLTDGDGGSSNTLLGRITTSAVDDAPTIAVVAPRTTPEDVAKVFSAYIGNAITVGDVDAGSALLRLSVSAQHGTVTLGSLRGLVFSVGDGTADVTMTFTGTLADLNHALDRVAFNPTPDYNGPAALDFVLNDLGNSGSGGALSASASQLITVLPVNDAPTIADGTALALIATDEDTPSAPITVGSVLAAGALGYSDVDGAAARGIAVTATLGRGRWQFSDDGANWADLGAVSASHALLLDAATWLRYLPDGDNGEAASLDFRGWDESSGSAATLAAPAYADPGAGGGSSAFSTGAARVLAQVASVNDAPSQIVALNPVPFSIAENSAIGTVVATVAAVDVDTGDAAGYALVDSAGGRFAIDVASGEIRVADGSRLDFEAAGAHQITVRATDRGGLSLDRTFTITLVDVNEAPRAVADAAAAAEAGGTLNGTPGTDPAGNLFANDSDPDAGDHLTLAGIAAGSGSAPAGNVGTAVAGQWGTLTAQADGSWRYIVDNANPAVQALRDAAAMLTDTFSYTVRDDAGLLATAQLTVTVHGANDAPAIAAPAAATVAEDGVLHFGAAWGNALLLSDVDGGVADRWQLTIAVSHGSLTFAGPAGQSGAPGLTLNGTLAELNAALDGLRVAPEADFDGAALLTLGLVDAGGLAAGGSVAIDVTPVDDAPLPAANAGLTVAENSRSNVIGAALLRSVDIDTASAQIVYTVTAAPVHGSLRLNGVALVASGNFTQADIDAGRLGYDHDGSETSADGFAFSVADGTGTAFSGRFEITVTPVNRHAPVFSSATAVQVAENGRAVLTLVASDADLPAQPLRYAIVGGADAARFTVDATSGVLAFVTAPDFEAPDDADGDHVYQLEVAASDGELETRQAISIGVRDVNEAPSARASTVALAEDGVHRFTAADFGFADADAGDALGAVRIEGLPAEGVLALGGAAVQAGQVIAAAELALLRYVPAPDANGSGNAFAFSVSDRGGLWSAAPALLRLDIAAVNDPPRITSDGGGALARLTVAENSRAVTTVVATDVDLPAATLVYRIAGGDDAALFTIDAASGALGFVIAPDFEAPADADGDNVYDVVVEAGDGSLSARQLLRVAVGNVDEAPAAEPAPAPAPAPAATVGTEPAANRPAVTVAVAVAVPVVGIAPAATPAVDGTAGPLSAPRADEMAAAVPRAELRSAPADDARQAIGVEPPAVPVAAAAAAPEAVLLPPRAPRLPRAEASLPVPDLLVDLPADERRGGEQFALQLDAVMASRSADRGAVRAADAAPPEADADPAADAPGALALQAVRAAGSALTAGTVWWALRAGGLMASLLVVLPAWRHVDLLAVLPDDEDDPWEHLGEDGTEGRPDPADDEAARDEQAVRRVFEPTSAGEHR